MSSRPSAPPAVRWITRTLEDAGYETWAVGGAVRDALLGHPSGDWDLATRARPEEVGGLFRRTVPIGIDHGTIGVLARDRTMYEVTTFRRDVETDGRHAIVVFADTLDEDLGRRDFTINAVAWHPLREELHDPFDGAGDLERRVLRTVGDPHARFREDYLRILRALRFAGRFQLQIDDATWAAVQAHVDQLPDLSAERIREELVKVLAADPAPAASLALYARSGALRVVYPELDTLRSVDAETVLGRAVVPTQTRAGGPSVDASATESPAAGPVVVPGADGAADWAAGSAWWLAVASASGLPVARPWLRLATLLMDVPAADAAALLVRLRLSNQQTDRVARLASCAALPSPEAGPPAVRRWLSVHGVESLPGFARLALARARAEARRGPGVPFGDVVCSWRRLRAVRSAAPPLTLADLALDGRDLISLGLKPGPDFARILDDLLDWVLDDPERNRSALLEERVLARVREVRRGDHMGDHRG